MLTIGSSGGDEDFIVEKSLFEGDGRLFDELDCQLGGIGLVRSETNFAKAAFSKDFVESDSGVSDAHERQSMEARVMLLGEGFGGGNLHSFRGEMQVLVGGNQHRAEAEAEAWRGQDGGGEFRREPLKC